LRTSNYRRKGIASLPVTIFFIALVATAFVGVSALASGQSGLASRQVGVENVLAARQQELGGLVASSSGNGMLQLTENSGVATDIVYALAQTSGGQSASVPVNYAVSPGQTMTVNLTSLVESMFGGSIPGGLASVTLVTDSGLYITSQVQAVQQSKQVTTYQQQQVQQSGQKFVGWRVTELTNPLVGYNVVETTTSSVQSGYDVTAHYQVTTQVLSGYDVYMTVAHTTYTCPSGWTNYQDGLCSLTTTKSVLVGEQYWAHYCYFPLFFICGNELLYLVTFPKVIMYTYMVPIYRTETVTTYQSATANTYYTTQYEGFSSTCPSGDSCTPVYTTQTTYQSESLGQLSYCPSPNRFTGTSYTCTPAYSQQTTTTNLGQMSYCPSGSQYSCTPVYGTQTTNLGTLPSCPSGSVYSCSAVYQSYTYTVTETVPVTQTVYYTALSTPVSSWLIGG
jgi:hypothetical protein